MKQINWSRQIQDLSINHEKLEADFLDWANLNLTGWNNNATITGLVAGTLSNDAVNYQQLQDAIDWIKQKFHARAISPTTNVSISWPQTVDWVSLVDWDYCLLWWQTTSTEDWLYIVRAGAWERAVHWETWDEVWAFLVAIQEGTTYNNTGWIVTNDKGSDIVGTDDLVLLQSYWPWAVGASNWLSMGGSDVILWGDLTMNTTINCDGYNFQIQGTGGMRRFRQQDNSGKGLTLTADYAVLFQGNKQISLHRSLDGIMINDTSDSTWLRYGGDYSANNTGANYNARWLPDLEYVETLITGSGTWNKESHTLTAWEITAGSFTVSHSVLANSMDFVFNGNVEAEGDDYTVSGTTVTLVTPGDWVAGDVIKLKYQY